MTFVLGFFLALAESSLGLGMVLPGEVAITGLAASSGNPLSWVALTIAVALGATAGDHVGFLLGRRSGTSLRSSRAVARLGVHRWDRASALVDKHGFAAVLVSRLLPFIRTVTPAVAGAAGLRYRRFLVASQLGAMAWASLWVGAGAAMSWAGSSII